MYRPLQFQKRSQHFLGTYDETLSVAMRVNNPDRSHLRICRRHACHYSQRSGAVSSVVERLVYTERVGGSKPSPPIF